MKDYPSVGRFARIAANAAGRFDFTSDEQNEVINEVLKKHHGFVVTAVNSFMASMTIEELETMSACEKDAILTICNAHMWSHTAYVIIEKVVSDIYKLVCLEA